MGAFLPPLDIVESFLLQSVSTPGSSIQDECRQLAFLPIKGHNSYSLLFSRPMAFELQIIAVTSIERDTGAAMDKHGGRCSGGHEGSRP